MALIWPPRDPDEDLDYDVRWAKRLQGDTITSSQFELVSGDAVLGAQQSSATTTKLWISGGTPGTTAAFLNKIETAAGRKLEATIYQRIKEK